MELSNIIDNKGNHISIGAEVSSHATGGEGKLYSIIGRPNEVAKIFKDSSCERQKHEKLLKMIKNPPSGSKQKPANGVVRIAWPISILYKPGGKWHDECIGFTMPYFDGAVPIDFLIHPSRRKEYGLTDSSLPAYAAYNLASIMDYLHTKGYIIGDVSSDNFMVDTDGNVYAVDTDSYQFDKNQCTVNHPDYCPKEYLDARDSKRHIQYTEEGDRFGLAKIIFQLMMNGFDAHQGIDPYHHDAIEINIHCVQRGIFAYKNDQSYTPSPHSPSYENVVPEDVRELFERCFCDGALTPKSRPKCYEWKQPLLDFVDLLDNDDSYRNWYIQQIKIPYSKSTVYQKDTIMPYTPTESVSPTIFTDPPTDISLKVLPVTICLDISESMKIDNRIGKLNDGVGDLLRTLKSHPKAKKVVELSVITFGGAPKVIKDFTPIMSVAPPHLETVDGYTPLYRTLELAFSNLDAYSEKASIEGRQLRRPIIMIMTDGEPTDASDRAKIISRVEAYKQHNHRIHSVDIVAVGIGNKYKPSVLDELCTKNWVMELYKGRTDLLEEKVSPDVRKKIYSHINLDDSSDDMIQFFSLFSDSVSQSVNG